MKEHFLLQKNRQLRLLLAFAIFLVGGIFFTPTKAFAVELVEDVMPWGYDYPNTYYVTNMEELNEAFGGNHLINGQTLILQENVELDHDIMIDYFVGNNCIIDLNGKTIKKNSGYFLILGRALEAGADFVQLIGKGRIVSDEGAYLFWDDSVGYRLILSGDIVYRTSGEFFTTIKNLTIENGDFKEIARTNESGDTVDDIRIGDMEGAFDGEVAITGGRFRSRLHFDTYRCTITGGIFEKDISIARGTSAISGGVIKGSVGFRGKLTVKENAYIRDGIVLKGETGTCIIKGGYIGGKKYAIYILADGEDPDQDYVTLDITGGTIESRSKNGYGIYCEGTPPCRVTIKNCTIRSKNGNGKSAIYLKDAQNVKLKADAGKKTLIKGFKYGLVDKNGGNVKIDKKAVVKASLTKKKYTSKDKLDKTIKGNLTIYRE